MRTRHKLTAVGAVALATSAIGGGAVATSHAMADSTTPVKGTMTVISMTSGSDGAIKCVYDNIDLPTIAVGGAPGTSGSQINVIGSGPVDANGKPVAGTVTVSSGSAVLPDGEAPAGGPTLVTGGAGVSTGGPVLSGLPPGGPFAIDSENARPGTPEECAALKPTTAALPAPPTAP
ncbi:MAG: hypothetical protein ACXWBO_04140 [Ilumatobacteraceae bacterium]